MPEMQDRKGYASNIVRHSERWRVSLYGLWEGLQKRGFVIVMDLDEALDRRLRQIKDFLKILALLVFIICLLLSLQ